MPLFRRAPKPEATTPEATPETVTSAEIAESAPPEVLAASAASYMDAVADNAATEEFPQQPSQQPPQRKQRRPLLPFVINWPAMFLIVLLVAFTVAALLYNQGELPDQIVAWWPLALMFPAGVWFLVALLSRDPHGLLGGAALFGLSASLLLASQKVDLLPTVVG